MRLRLFKIPQTGIQVNTLNEDDYMLGVFGDENRSIAKFDSKVGKIQVQETDSLGIFHAVFTEVQKLNETDSLDYEWVVGLSWLRSENYGKLQGEIRKQYFLAKSTCTYIAHSNCFLKYFPYVEINFADLTRVIIFLKLRYTRILFFCIVFTNSHAHIAGVIIINFKVKRMLESLNQHSEF